LKHSSRFFLIYISAIFTTAVAVVCFLLKKSAVTPNGWDEFGAGADVVPHSKGKLWLYLAIA